MPSANCDYCGLPPRENPLRRCSRCHNAWYHDQNCQKQHFPEHKSICIPWQKQQKPLNSTTAPLLYQTQVRNGRGRCWVATRSIRTGQVWASTKTIKETGSSNFVPLVPPVLNEAHRDTRCALCFATLSVNPAANQPLMDEDQVDSLYPVKYCSESCQATAKSWGFSDEQACITRLASRQYGPPRILSTAVLVWRLLRAMRTNPRSDGTIENALLELQSCDASSEDALDHSRAVLATVLGMLRVSAETSSSRGQHEDDDNDDDMATMAQRVTDMIGKIRINGFSICDGESVALGIGIFPIASAINHSCRPNVLQTFSYGSVSGQLPSLRITACSDIAQGEEICISYIENTLPRDMRQRLLRQHYGFSCDCSACSDMKRESLLEAIRCPSCEGGQGELQEDGSFLCPSCGNEDFRKHLDIVRRFRQCDPSDEDDNRQRVRQLESLVHALQRACFRSSCHIRECGEQLFQATLESLGQSSSESEQLQIASKALTIASEIESCKLVCEDEGWMKIRTNLLAYKVAKLQLYVMPDPRAAMEKLRKVQTELRVFFPSGHELMKGLDACLQPMG